MTITTDPNDPRLEQYRRKGHDEAPVKQQEVYLALSAEELAKGLLLPVRRAYIHQNCGGQTTMPQACAETYARDPWFYSGTYCCTCSMHRPMEEFKWVDGQSMSSLHWTDEEMAQVSDRKKALQSE